MCVCVRVYVKQENDVCQERAQTRSSKVKYMYVYTCEYTQVYVHMYINVYAYVYMCM